MLAFLRSCDTFSVALIFWINLYKQSVIFRGPCFHTSNEIPSLPGAFPYFIDQAADISLSMSGGSPSSGTKGLCFILSVAALSRPPETFNSWLEWSKSFFRICPFSCGFLSVTIVKLDQSSLLWVMISLKPACRRFSYTFCLLRFEVLSIFSFTI